MPSAGREAKRAIDAGDTVRIITNNGSAELDVTTRSRDPRTLLLARKLVNHSADMIFVVEDARLPATGQWKHGRHAHDRLFRARHLLDKFYRRELDIRPATRCAAEVDFETSYGPDHEVLAERYRDRRDPRGSACVGTRQHASARERRPAMPLPRDSS